jgi:hypothetical protein
MQKNITIIGFVRKIGANWKIPRTCIVSEDGLFVVSMQPAGKNLICEVGNRVKATGSISESRDGFRKISVSSYEVCESRDNDNNNFGFDPEYAQDSSIINTEQM